MADVNQTRPIKTCLSGFVIVLLLVAACSASQGEDWTSLMAGEILVEATRNQDGVRGVRATFVVDATREEIWGTLVDYENFPQFFRGIDRMKVIEESASGATIEFWVDAVLSDLHYVLRRTYVQNGYRLTWRRESGDLKRIEGSWTIRGTPDGEKYLLVYESYVDIGLKIVTYFIQQGAISRAEEMALSLRNWIEGK
jgi:carbon monoxide dehydrogenase subunit G